MYPSQSGYYGNQPGYPPPPSQGALPQYPQDGSFSHPQQPGQTPEQEAMQQ